VELSLGQPPETTNEFYLFKKNRNKEKNGKEFSKKDLGKRI
jgi:hypothetical protein